MSFHTTRKIEAPLEEVYLTMTTPEHLEIWWGPAGFTNTFEICEMKSGGRWVYTMHGPDGKSYPNECVFTELEPLKKLVVRHVVLPHYTLVIELKEDNGGTLVSWTQTFDKPEVAKAIAHIVVPANEQNLDRLSAEVLKKH